MSKKTENAPESPYVRELYDSLLAKLPGSYSDFRWNETEISRFHYRQSRRALLRGLSIVPERLSRALEIGGGGGAWTQFFSRRAEQLDFLDISEEMLNEAKTALMKCNNIRYIHADFLEWETDPDVYDLIVSIRNIEYMQDKHAVFARMSKALKRGGTLIVSTKSPHFDWTGYFEKRKLHGGQIAITDLISELKSNSFRVERVYPAIMGKLIRYAPVRLLCDGLQWTLLRVPYAFMPYNLLKYVSESFLVVARRV